MDITNLIGIILWFFVPYLQKAGEWIAWEVGKDLWTKIKKLFTSNNETATIETFEKHPEEWKNLFAKILQELLEKSPESAKEIEEIINNNKTEINKFINSFKIEEVKDLDVKISAPTKMQDSFGGKKRENVKISIWDNKKETTDEDKNKTGIDIEHSFNWNFENSTINIGSIIINWTSNVYMESTSEEDIKNRFGNIYKLDIDYKKGLIDDKWDPLSDNVLEKLFVKLHSHIKNRETFIIIPELYNWRIWEWPVNMLMQQIQKLKEKWEARTTQEEYIFENLKTQSKRLEKTKDKISYCMRYFFLLNYQLSYLYNFQTFKSLISLIAKDQQLDITHLIKFIGHNDSIKNDFHFKFFIAPELIWTKDYPSKELIERWKFEVLSLPENFITSEVVPAMIYYIYMDFHKDISKMTPWSSNEDLKKTNNDLEKKFFDYRKEWVFDIWLYNISIDD